MMRNENIRELFENRENDWLSEEIRYERRVKPGFDFNEGTILKQSHQGDCEVREIAAQHERIHKQATARSRNYKSASYTSGKKNKAAGAIVATVIAIIFIFSFISIITEEFIGMGPFGYHFNIFDILSVLLSFVIPIIIFVSIAISIRNAVKKH